MDLLEQSGLIQIIQIVFFVSEDNLLEPFPSAEILTAEKD